MMMRILLLLWTVMIAHEAAGQLSFTDRSDMLSQSDFYSGVAIGIADVNGDGLDDIVRMNQGRFLQIEYQTSGCDQFSQSRNAQQVFQNSAWNIMVGDVNNDGLGDVLTGSASEGVRSLVAIPFADSFSLLELPNSRFFAQAANLVDINVDGYLDAFICDDDAESKVYINQGNGSFAASDLIDFSTVPPSDNSGNYGSVWSDFDSDGDLDLYIAKCRQGVDDPADPRRINMLFVNDGNNQFTNLADSFGLADAGQSWTGDFGDLDGDGDLDCFVTNHDRPSVIYENLGDTLFVDITDSTGVTPSGIIVQGVLQDLNNDGMLDIIVSGTRDDIFLNHGGMEFIKWEGILDDEQIESFSIGDLNNDGFLDIYAGYADLFTSPSNIPDKLWMNDGNENHYIRFQLRGDSSNADGIGSRIEIYGDWGKQIREIRAGESYGISLSHIAHFGIGQATSVDSAVVSWPSGIRQVLESPQINNLHIVREGDCFYQPVNLDAPCLELCAGDTVMVAAPPGYADYAWSHGDTGRVIRIDEPGMYFSEMSNTAGCRLHTFPVHVRAGELPADLPLSDTGTVRACKGTEIELTAPEVPSYLWNTGDTTRSISIKASGIYFTQLITACETAYSDTVTFEFTDPGIPVVRNDTIQGPGSGSLSSESENTYWFLNQLDTVPVFQGDTFPTPDRDETTIFYAAFTDTIRFDTQFVGQTRHTGFTFYNSAQFNGGILFDVHAPVDLESVEIFTEFPGPRIIEIRNSEEELIFATDTIHVTEFQTRVRLDIVLEPGLGYTMSTRESLNNAAFGMNSPRLYRSDNMVSYPYQVPELITLQSSLFGADFFYYFYNWKVRKADLVCTGEKVPATLVVDPQVGIENPSRPFPGKVYPVPANEWLDIQLHGMNGPCLLRLISAQGQQVYATRIFSGENKRVNVSKMPAGLYFLILETDHRKYQRRIAVIH